MDDELIDNVPEVPEDLFEVPEVPIEDVPISPIIDSSEMDEVLIGASTEVSTNDVITIDMLIPDVTIHMPKIITNNFMIGTANDCTRLIQLDEIQAPVIGAAQDMWDKLADFEERAWDPNNRGLNLPWTKYDTAMNGLQPGWHIIGGDSNHGKSALLTSVEVGLCDKNNNVYILSFSLDDSFDDKIARVGAIAANKDINFVKNPQRKGITNDITDPWHIAWKNSIMRMRMISAKMSVYDATFSTYIEEIEKKIVDTLAELDVQEKLTGVKTKLVVTIDNFHDLDTTHPDAKGSDNAKYEYLAKQIKFMSTIYHIPIITTAELRKAQGSRRPAISDIRSAGKSMYGAVSIVLVYNEVSVKGESSQIFYQLPNETSKRPVLEAHFAKNKCSDYKGRMYFMFMPDCVKLAPASVEADRKFSQKIYG